MTLREAMAQAVKMIEDQGKEYATARALSWQLQEMRKVVLANEMNKIESGTIVDRENKARCSEIYKTHIAGTAEAIEKELKLKASCERWMAQWESVRSLLSYEKKQLQTFQED